MTRKEMIKMIVRNGFPYIIAASFTEMHIRYGYTLPYVGRPESVELDEDMSVLGHVPIEHVSFNGKHPDFGDCTFTLQKYTRTRNPRKAYYCMFIFEDGTIWDERGPFAERELYSDIILGSDLMDRFMKSKDSYATGLKITNPVSEIKHITTSPA
jgi:hypothetical protein